MEEAFFSKMKYKDRYTQMIRGSTKDLTKMKCSICKRTNHEDKDCYFRDKKPRAHMVEDNTEDGGQPSHTANLMEDSWAI